MNQRSRPFPHGQQTNKKQDSKPKREAQEGSPALLQSLRPSLRVTVFEHVLNIRKRDHLFPFDMSTTLRIAQVCKQFAKDVQDMYGNFPLHVDQALGPAVTDRDFASRKILQGAFSPNIPVLSVLVRLIQSVEWRRTESLLEGILNLPRMYPASQILVPDIKLGVVSSISACTPSVLAKVLARKQRSPDAPNRYIASFASAHHANVFSWLRFTDLGVDHLIIRLLGTQLWDRHYFTDATQFYRALTIVTVMASIIANKPYGIHKITLTGLGPFARMIKNMFEEIPQRTPIDGVDELLDMLIAYPFTEMMRDMKQLRVDEGGQVTMDGREENLIRLRSETEWQAMIIRARHDKRQPEWELIKQSWSKYVIEGSRRRR